MDVLSAMVKLVLNVKKAISWTSQPISVGSHARMDFMEILKQKLVKNVIQAA